MHGIAAVGGSHIEGPDQNAAEAGIPGAGNLVAAEQISGNRAGTTQLFVTITCRLQPQHRQDYRN